MGACIRSICAAGMANAREESMITIDCSTKEESRGFGSLKNSKIGTVAVALVVKLE